MHALSTFVLTIVGIAAPAFAVANILFRPMLPEFEGAYVFVHRAHSVAWYEQTPTRRGRALEECVHMAQRGVYSGSCVNVWAAEAAVGDHARLRELGAASDRDWAVPTSVDQ